MAALDLKTFGDIIEAAREELKIGSTDTSTINRLKRDFNIVYRETCNKNRWWWLKRTMSAHVPPFYSQGTCQVFRNNNKVIFTQILGESKKGHKFSVDGSNEIYTIESHTAGTNTIKLSQSFVGNTAFGVGYKIWNDKIVLPTQLKETVEVLCHNVRAPLEALGNQEYKRLMSAVPKKEGVPSHYFTDDFTEPFSSTAISMPALISRKSDGAVKTLVFASAVPATIVANAPITVSRAQQASFNGEYLVGSVSTTNVANDTIVYSGLEEYTELSQADDELVVSLTASQVNRTRFRTMTVYPAITRDRIQLQIDYNIQIVPLENLQDEPLVPIEDRAVLLYGVLHRAWSRERNPEEAARNLQLYSTKLGLMAAQIQDSLDTPRLQPSKLYLASRRKSFRSRRFSMSFGGFGSGVGAQGGSAVAVLGLPNSVAIFNAGGELEGSASISTAELGYLDGASSNIQAQLDAIDAVISSAFVVDATVSPTAAIQRSKLAAGTANTVVVNNGSGVMADSAITSTELSFLSGVIPVTAVTLANNVAAPTAAFSIPVANSYCFILYSILRGTSNLEGGYMLLLNDGVSVDLTIASGDLAPTGIGLSADISGGNVRVLYTSTNTGFTAQLKYAVIKWAA